MENKESNDIQKVSDIKPVQQMIASCSGAIVTSIFVTPLDVVKIRLQSQQKTFRRGSCFVYNNGLMDCLCVCSHCTNGNGATSQNLQSVGQTAIRPWYQRPGHFNGTWDAFTKIARNEGVTALWSGLPPTLVMSVPATVVYFTLYDQLKEKLGYDKNNPNTQYLPVMAGCMARVFASSIICPLELVRTKMQSQQLSYSQIGQAIKISVKHGGLLSLMRGLGPSLLRDVPFSAIYWFSYEKMKAYQLHLSNSQQVTFLQAFIGGATAGTIAGIITLPFDVIKTHRQIELGEAMVFNKDVPSSTWSLIQRLYRQKGFSALFAGLVPRVIKIAPACAMMIGSYEYGKAFFQSYNEQQNRDRWTVGQ